MNRTFNDAETITAYDYRRWTEYELEDYGDFAERVQFVNQVEYGDDTTSGAWFYGDEEKLAIYTGSFGCYHSPGSSHHTRADIYPDRESFDEALADLESLPEYL